MRTVLQLGALLGVLAWASCAPATYQLEPEAWQEYRTARASRTQSQ